MDKTTLLTRLSDIEWDDLEVKDASHGLPKSAWETVSAFSNSAGGWIVFGVAQKGKSFEITGVPNPEKIEQDFVGVLRSRNKFNVLILPKCKKYRIDGKTVLAFFIPSAEKKPVFFNALQNSFIRTASGDQRASDSELNALYRDQAFGTMSGKTVEGTSAASLHRPSYRDFRRYLKQIVPDFRYNSLNDKEFNQKLQITKNGKLTYGGLLFLGKNQVIQDQFPDFRIDYLEIPGTSYADASDRYTFRVQEQENLWSYYFVLIQRLQNFANNPMRIGALGIAHENTKAFEALREGLVNLLIHSDYFSPMKPRIRVFTDRIEFENPGSLPLPVNQLVNAAISIPRNPVLAKFFRYAKLCESAGYGFDKMKAWEKEMNEKVLFETTLERTKMIFLKNEDSPENPKPPEEPPENSQKTAGKQPENSQNLAQQILNLVTRYPKISRADIATQLHTTESKARYALDKLKSDGALERLGADKGGSWIVKLEA